MSLEKVQSSPTLEMVNTVLEKQARGEKVVSLAIGEPGFATPKEIIEAAYSSMNKGETHYISSYGLPEVRRAIQRKAQRKNGISATVDNTIFITTKLSVYASLLAIGSEHFDVLVPDPGYFYSEPIILLGGEPVRYRLSTDFSFDIDEVKKKTSTHTRAIIINTPSNPTGKVLDSSQLKELYEFCNDRKIYIISDEAYEDIIFEKQHFSVGSLETRPDTVISLFSLSKSYAMTGWRAGYVIANEKVVHGIYKFMENALSCFPPFIQRASAYALDNGDGFVNQFREEFAKRRKLLLEKMSEIKMLEPNQIEGSFYSFPRYRSQERSVDLAKRILASQNVAVLPGTSFGPAGEGHVRVSFSGHTEEIEDGMQKIKVFFEKER
jgi:aspartate/methionine/tyrosine aminotransferase